MLISKFDTADIEEKIQRLESRCAIVLPESYRKFLSRYNGGLTPETFFRVQRVSSDVRAFYGLGDVEYSLDSLDLEEWIHRNFFPIACDSFGNDIMLGLAGDSAGAVFFWDHELGSAKKLTPDLKSFVKACRSEKISPYATKPIAEREADLIARGRGHVITESLKRAWQEEIDRFSNIVQQRVVIE